MHRVFAIARQVSSIVFFDNYARESLDHPVHPQELATLFELNKRTVWNDLLHGPQQPGPLGRHVVLDGEIELSLIRMLLDAFHEQKAMTQTKFLKIIGEQQNPKLTKGWLHDFIGRHLDELQICRSLPREDLQMAVPRAYLEDHICILYTHITGRVAELVFNLDELGSADWEDRKAKKVIVPAGVPKEDVHHPVSRRHRHTMLLACVSASGDALTALLIMGSPIPESLWSRGLRQDEDAMIRHRLPAYITEELLYDCISTVFIPYVLAVRDRASFEDEIAVLLMDSAVPHTSERVRRLLGENNIIAVTFPAHTTNLFQALDLVFFGVFRKLKASATGEFDDDSVSAQIIKLIQAYEQTATSSTIRGSCLPAGFEHDTAIRSFKLRVVEERLRGNPGFRETWARDVSVESLSARGRAQRFGVINSEFLPE
jgi:hypothetical protein